MLMVISVVVLVAPLQVLVKGLQLAVGLFFFVFCPIWNRYPQYRQVASPLKWIFWKVPTHGACQCPLSSSDLDLHTSPNADSELQSIAEWAMARLQAEAVFQATEMHRAATDKENHKGHGLERSGIPTAADSPAAGPDMSPSVVGQYHCTSRERLGRLTITNEGVGFKQHLSKERSWQLRYEDIKVMQKVGNHSRTSFFSFPFPGVNVHGLSQKTTLTTCLGYWGPNGRYRRCPPLHRHE